VTMRVHYSPGLLKKAAAKDAAGTAPEIAVPTKTPSGQKTDGAADAVCRLAAEGAAVSQKMADLVLGGGLPAVCDFSVRAPSTSFSSIPRAAESAVLQSLSGATMGTTWSVRFVNTGFEPLQRIRALIESTLEQVIAQMSNWESDSEISRFNRAAPGQWVQVSREHMQVLQAALEWAHECGGVWDPTVGALVQAWGFGPAAQRTNASGTVDVAWPQRVPSQACIAQALQSVGYQRLALQVAEQQVYQPGGCQLDLSGIAKGFAVDWVAQRLLEAGFASSLVEIGGELRATGVRPDGKAWRVAVANPYAAANMPPMVLPLGGALPAVATSGDHYHAFEHLGRRYSHTVDPRTGQPVAHALTSVTVMHASCMHADALATVITVLGPQAGWAFAKQRGLAVLMCEHASPEHPQGHVQMTDAFAQALSPADRADALSPQSLRTERGS
jgi:thiamine biosynthesis lipoprotein